MEAGGGCGCVQGEEQKKLDVITNRVLKQALRFTGRLSVIASEEEDVPVWLGDEKFDQNSDNLRTSDVVVEEGNKVVARVVASSRQRIGHEARCSLAGLLCVVGCCCCCSMWPCSTLWTAPATWTPR